VTNLVFSVFTELNHGEHSTFWTAEENCLPVLEQRAARIADLNIQTAKSSYTIQHLEMHTGH